MEPWREELYLQHGLFDSLRSKYKTVSGNVKKVAGTVNNTIKNKVSSGKKGSEWKNHKYIRKEGTRYIYKDDLKKTSKTTKRDSEKVEVDTGKIKRTYTDGFYGQGRELLNRFNPMVKIKDLYKPNNNTLVGERVGEGTYKYTPKLEKDIRDDHGKDNHIKETQEIYEGPDLGWDTTIFESNVKIENGKKWFKSEINLSVTEVIINRGSDGITRSTAAEYTISYSKARQILNKGKAFLSSLKNKRR